MSVVDIEQRKILRGARQASRSKSAACRIAACVAFAVVLAAPVVSYARPALSTGSIFGTMQQDDDSGQEAQDRAQAERDRAQEKRDREQEARDREQEQKDREQERLDRLSELYEEGREALDEERYDRAAQNLRNWQKSNSKEIDAALYWKAYAENRLGKRDWPWQPSPN